MWFIVSVILTEWALYLDRFFPICCSIILLFPGAFCFKFLLNRRSLKSNDRISHSVYMTYLYILCIFHVPGARQDCGSHGIAFSSAAQPFADASIARNKFGAYLCKDCFTAFKGKTLVYENLLQQLILIMLIELKVHLTPKIFFL